MAGRQAKVLSPSALSRVLKYTKRTHSNPARSRAIVLLSVKAGLRAAEIAKLEWPMVLDANGRVSHTIELSDHIAKKGAGRRIPMHSELRSALTTLLLRGRGGGPVIKSARGGAVPPNSVVNWFVSLYGELGLDGCSSHSGRRTFITRAARNAHRAHGSIRDVQLLAGHASIETTQRYIDGDSDAQRRLVSLI